MQTVLWEYFDAAYFNSGKNYCRLSYVVASCNNDFWQDSFCLSCFVSKTLNPLGNCAVETQGEDCKHKKELRFFQDTPINRLHCILGIMDYNLDSYTNFNPCDQVRLWLERIIHFILQL